MLGAYITFAVVLAIVAIYMTVVHSFLRAAEDPQDEEREEKLRHASEPRHAVAERTHTQYAH